LALKTHMWVLAMMIHEMEGERESKPFNLVATSLVISVNEVWYCPQRRKYILKYSIYFKISVYSIKNNCFKMNVMFTFEYKHS